jgi:hypothetical protein
LLLYTSSNELPIGITAGVSSTLHTAKYMEDKSAIELYDMSFLYELEILSRHKNPEHG